MRNIWKFSIVVLVLTIASGLLATLPSTVIAGTTITVNTIVDELNSDGDCSLREAIQAANADSTVDVCPAGSGTDTIVLPAGTYTLSLVGTAEDSNVNGDLDISSGVVIQGGGAASTIIDGNGDERIFDIRAGGSAAISEVTIRNGAEPSGNGGAINVTTGTTLTLSNSTVTGNTANTGSGINIYGSGSHMLIEDVTISGNISRAGSGIRYLGGTVTIRNTTISGNQVTCDNSGCFGGAAILIDPTGQGSMSISHSTITSNSSLSNGGGITKLSGGLHPINIPVTTTNTIIAGNTAPMAAPDCRGSIDSGGFNIVGDNSDCTFSALPSDQIGTRSLSN